MRLLALSLVAIATAAYADQASYDQAVTLAKAEHNAVVARHCLPMKYKQDQEKCKRDADKTLADVLKDLRKKHLVK